MTIHPLVPRRKSPIRLIGNGQHPDGATFPYVAAPFPFEGVVDEIRLWDHARALEEIDMDRFLVLSGTEPGLVA